MGELPESNLSNFHFFVSSEADIILPQDFLGKLEIALWSVLTYETCQQVAFALVDGKKRYVISKVTFEDLKWIRKNWKGKLVVKGIQNVDDAVKSVSAGADAIILSNHGGRQLDRAPVPFLLLPEVRKKIGKKAELHMDTGIMHGADIVAADTHRNAGRWRCGQDVVGSGLRYRHRWGLLMLLG